MVCAQCSECSLGCWSCECIQCAGLCSYRCQCCCCSAETALPLQGVPPVVGCCFAMAHPQGCYPEGCGCCMRFSELKGKDESGGAFAPVPSAANEMHR